MAGPTRRFYLKVLRETLQLLDEAGVDYLLIGGVATNALLEIALDEEDDIDLFVPVEGREEVLRLLSDAGYSTSRRDERWVYKAAQPDVTIDLIFRAGEVIRLDRDHLEHSRIVRLDDVHLRVPSPEDLAVMKAVFDADDRSGRWYGALRVLKSLPIDWAYLCRRGRELAPRRILSLLLYAQDDGLDVPKEVLADLAAGALPGLVAANPDEPIGFRDRPTYAAR